MEAKIKKRQNKIDTMMEKHMKRLEDPDQIQKYISGEKGKVLSLNFDPEQGPQFDPEDL